MGTTPDRIEPLELDGMHHSAGLLGRRGHEGLHIWIIDFFLSLASQ